MILTDLQADLLMNILFRLPVNSILLVRCVNKSFRDLISDPIFIKMHSKFCQNKIPYIVIKRLSDCYRRQFHFLHRDEMLIAEESQLELPLLNSPKDFDVRDSYNGLLLVEYPLRSNSHHDMYLWNPTIRKVVRLPASPIPPSSSARVIYGLGFLKQVDDYKILRISHEICHQPFTVPKDPPIVEILSLNEGAWRRIEAVIPYRIDSITSRGLIEENAHWIARKRIDGNNFQDFVLSFDMVREEFHEIMVPDCCLIDGKMTGALVVLEERLHLFVRGPETDPGWHVWELNANVSTGRWSKQYHMKCDGSTFWPLCYRKNGQLVLVYVEGYLALYIPDIEMSIILACNEDLYILDAFSHTESLALLDRRGELVP